MLSGGQRPDRSLGRRPVVHRHLHDHAAGRPWTSADNGTYTINLGGSPVSDTDGNTIPTGTLGTFDVETAKIAIFKFGLIPNRRTGFWSGTILLQNTGSSAFSGPMFVLFTLPSGATSRMPPVTYGG